MIQHRRLHLMKQLDEAVRGHRSRAHIARELRLATLYQLRAETRWQRWRKDFTDRELIIMGIAFVFAVVAYVGGIVGRLFL